MTLPGVYATVSQLQTYWGRVLSSTAEQERATDLLGRAAVLINEIPGAEAFSAAACEHVSLDMVKRAMLSRGDGVVQTTASMSDMSGSTRYLNPVGNLYITSGEQARLTGNSAPVFSLTPTSNVRVPQTHWNYQQSSQSEPEST